MHVHPVQVVFEKCHRTPQRQYPCGFHPSSETRAPNREYFAPRRALFHAGLSQVQETYALKSMQGLCTPALLARIRVPGDVHFWSYNS